MSTTTVPIPTRLLVVGMTHHDGTIRAEELYEVADACGQSAEQVRSCLRRLVSEGLFSRSGTGRSAVFTVTERGSTDLWNRLRRTRLALAQDAAGRGWDGRWHLAAYAVPESRRAARDGFRDRLLAFGGAAIQGGLYVSPHNWERDVREAAGQLEMADHLSLVVTDDLEVAGQRNPRELAAHLWPLTQVAERYERFLTDNQGVLEELEDLKQRRGRLADTTFLPLALAIGVAYDECASLDPYLPPELLPRPWPGRTARDLIVRARRLALLLREESGRPALFGMFDDMLETL